MTFIFFQVVIFFVATYFVLDALSQNINPYVTPSEVTSRATSIKKIIKVGGLVKIGSIHNDGLDTNFVITDYKAEFNVRFSGILPGLFREGKGVIIEGYLNGNDFLATNVLAKHDENYKPIGTKV